MRGGPLKIQRSDLTVAKVREAVGRNRVVRLPAETTAPLEMDVLGPDGIVSGDPCLGNARDRAALVRALVASGAAFIAQCASRLP